jgi:hypothetical protein
MNRFHSKFHRKNHHTNNDPYNPDAGHDPIASQDAPFQGNFFLNGSLSASGGVTLTNITIPAQGGIAGFIQLTAGANAFVFTNKVQVSSIILLTTQSVSSVAPITLPASAFTIGTPFVSRKQTSIGFQVSSTQIFDRSVLGWFLVQTQ